jgi:hypothetical protein
MSEATLTIKTTDEKGFVLATSDRDLGKQQRLVMSFLLTKQQGRTTADVERELIRLTRELLDDIESHLGK